MTGGGSAPARAVGARRVERRPECASAPFALTEMQQAYAADRLAGDAGGGGGDGEPAAADTVLVFEGELDPERFVRAWRALVRRHAALRLAFEGGEQRVLPETTEFPVRVVEPIDGCAGAPREPGGGDAVARSAPGGVHGNVPAAVPVARARPLDAWPFVDVELVALGGGDWRVTVAFDALVLDYASWQLVLGDLTRLYDGEEPASVPLEFRDAALAVAAPPEPEERARRDRDEAYWRDRAASLPAGPRLPRAAGAAGEGWRRTSTVLPAEAWRAMSAVAGRHRLLPSASITAAIAAVLRTASRDPGFSITIPRGDRPLLDRDMRRVVGVLSSFWPLEVDAPRASAAFAELAQGVHERMVEDLTHGSTTGVRIVRAALAARGGAPGTPFPVVVTHLPPAPAGALLGERLPRVDGVTAMPRATLDVRTEELADGSLRIDWDARDGWYPDRLVPWFAQRLLELLARLGDPDAWEEPLRLGEPVLDREALAPGAFAQPLDGLERLLAERFAEAAGAGGGAGERPAGLAGSDLVSDALRIGRFDDLAAACGLGALARAAAAIGDDLGLADLGAREVLAARDVAGLAARLREGERRPGRLDRIAALRLELREQPGG